jgi:hypothetical protein
MWQRRVSDGRADLKTKCIEPVKKRPGRSPVPDALDPEGRTDGLVETRPNRIAFRFSIFEHILNLQII